MKMEKLNEKTLSKIYASYIGAKIELCKSRFSEDQQDRIFTLDGVCSDGFYVKEMEGVKYEFIANDSLLVKDPFNISKEDLLYIHKTINEYSSDYIKSLITWLGIGIEFCTMGDYYYLLFNLLSFKEYALPFMGYSVDELIKLGVYKIKK